MGDVGRPDRIFSCSLIGTPMQDMIQVERTLGAALPKLNELKE